MLEQSCLYISATSAQHRSLVHLLLPFTRDNNCLSIAVGDFFWDIVGIILQYSRETGNVPIKIAQELSELSIVDKYFTALVSPLAH